MARQENIKISFLGMKLESNNPGTKTIIIIALLLIFFVVLVVLLPKLTVAAVSLNKLTHWLSSLPAIKK